MVSLIPSIVSGLRVPDTIFVFGESSYTAGSGQPALPDVGELTLLTSCTQDMQFGNHSDGNLPQAIEAIRDLLPTARIVAVRHDDGTTLSGVDAAQMADEAFGTFGFHVQVITTGDITWNVSAGTVDNTTANSLVAAMEQVATQVRCLFVASAPDGTIGEAVEWQASNTVDRGVGVYGQVVLPGETTLINPAPSVAAAIIKNNFLRGYWSNPSGAEVAVLRVQPIIEQLPDVSTADSQVLSVTNNLVTIVRGDAGFEMYGGNLLQASNSADSKRFISQRQIFDHWERFIRDAALQLSRRAKVNRAFVNSMIAIADGEMDRLSALGAINRPQSNFFPDDSLNTLTALNAGELSFVSVINGVKDVTTLNGLN